MKTTFLLNWSINPYHVPLLIAKSMGFYEAEGLDLSLLEPESPSEVTILAGEGKVDLALKAMVHCFAARSRGYPIKAVGTLFDEPPTGLISLKSNPVASVEDFKGKRLGYVGEFGKVMIDALAAEAGVSESEYECIRVRMNAAGAISDGRVDAAIGLSCYQQIELESRRGATEFLRIDHAAKLGCCCFCSILFIAHEEFLASNSDLIAAFLRATMKGSQFTRELPDEAFSVLCETRHHWKNALGRKIFSHCLPFFLRL